MLDPNCLVVHVKMLLIHWTSHAGIYILNASFHFMGDIGHRLIDLSYSTEEYCCAHSKILHNVSKYRSIHILFQNSRFFFRIADSFSE